VSTQEPYQNKSGGGERRNREDGDDTVQERQDYECARERGGYGRAQHSGENSDRPNMDVRREEAKESKQGECCIIASWRET